MNIFFHSLNTFPLLTQNIINPHFILKDNLAWQIIFNKRIRMADNISPNKK